MLLGRDAEAQLARRTAKPRWDFGADGAEFRLAAEAQRMQLAALSDPMLAVSTSDLQRCLIVAPGSLVAMAGGTGTLRFQQSGFETQ